MLEHGKIRIGTSGWRYDHWIGPVYPGGLAADDFLPHYAAALDSVEINSSFYGLPSRRTIQAWRDATPPRFLFAVKASRYITHLKKLKDPEAGISRLFRAVSPLREKLGPILFQLPPNWRVNTTRLAAFLAALPQDRRYAFEFRDPSWFAQEVVEILAMAGAAFCLYDLAGKQAPENITAGFAYVRLHGPRAAYRGNYDDAALKGWAARFSRWRDRGLDVYCYFDNDEAGNAFTNAVRLRQLVDAP